MLARKNEFVATALSYILAHGRRANFKISDDISRAIGAGKWTEVHGLQRAQSRIQRLQLCEQISARLTADKKASYAIDAQVGGDHLFIAAIN